VKSEIPISSRTLAQQLLLNCLFFFSGFSSIWLIGHLINLFVYELTGYVNWVNL
jgi:hypothetical protein